MKYWAYLNNEVSQQSYSEEELRQLPEFGPDILICSEVSAISQNPDWKTVRELLPHLIRPKAPDFSKFRPKPPVPGGQQNNQNPLPVPNVLPVGVNATPSAQQPKNVEPQNTNTNNPNQELLAQLESLTAKISSLENKIVEQEKELAVANGELNKDLPIGDQEINNFSEATFVSDPQNDEEDDVLEVPFDSDFEVPFDINKTSEEIAQEAEALLAKPSGEIEEYNADDPNADLMPFASSEMQGILEDTVRQTNAFENPYEQNYNKNENNQDNIEHAQTQTFIAQDLISKKTFDLTAKTEKDKENSSQVSDKKEEPKTTEYEAKKTQKETVDQIPAEQTSSEEIKTEENKEEANKQQEENVLVAEENKPVNQEEVKEDSQDVKEEKNQLLEEKNEEPTEEKVEEQLISEDKQETEEKPENTLISEEKLPVEEQVSENEFPADNLPEQGNTTEEETVEDNATEPELNSLDNIPQSSVTDTVEQQGDEPELVSLAELPVKEDNIIQEKNTVEEDQLPELPTLKDNTKQSLVEESSEEPLNEEQAEESNPEEPINIEPEQKEDDNIKISSSNNNVLASLEENKNENAVLSKEELNEDPSDEPMDEYEMTQGFTPEEDKNEEQILSVEELKEDPSDEPMDEYEMTQGFTPKYDNIKEQNTDQQSINLGQENSNEMPVIPENDSDLKSDTVSANEQSNEEDKSAELSMTGIALSNDPTTAAVLDEIAQEKSRNITAVTTTDKLFEELEKTYREGETNDNLNDILGEKQNDVAVESSNNSKEKLNDEFAKDDEFLKTFTTSVEEVFLDQPTTIISDYVPPSDNTEHGHPVVMNGNIIRKKPSDIKTVPLVPEAMGQEIWSAPYVESATAKVRRKSTIGRLILFSVVIVAVVILALGAVAGLAVMGILPEKLSPLHTIVSYYFLEKSPKESVETVEDLNMTPEIIEQESTAQIPVNQDNSNEPYSIVENVKNYTFSDGTTLEERIKTSNKISNAQLEWTLLPTEEQNVYSIAVRLPKNSVGQGFSYRFNYNNLDRVLTPTTSESKNIMENYLK